MVPFPQKERRPDLAVSPDPAFSLGLPSYIDVRVKIQGFGSVKN